MKFLLSTAAGVFAVDDSAHAERVSRVGCYGLTWDERQVFVAAESRIVSLATGDVVADLRPNRTKPCKRERLAGGVFGFSREDDRRDIHQINCTRSGKLFIADTANDSVALYDLRSGSLDADYFGTSQGKDATHVNSIYVDGSAVWVCHHNRDQGSFLCRYDEDGRRLYPEVGHRAHNIFARDGWVYTLDSSAGAIAVIDGTTGAVCHRVNIPWHGDELGFPRGLAVTSDYFFVGMSQSSGDRAMREAAHPCIAVLDRALRPVEVIRLPFLGQIKDLRVTSENDHAHNGITFPNGGEEWTKDFCSASSLRSSLYLSPSSGGQPSASCPRSARFATTCGR